MRGTDAVECDRGVKEEEGESGWRKRNSFFVQKENDGRQKVSRLRMVHNTAYSTPYLGEMSRFVPYLLQ